MKLFSVKIFIMQGDVIEEIKNQKSITRESGVVPAYSEKHWKMAILRVR